MAAKLEGSQKYVEQEPCIVKDPRYRAGRKLVISGKAQEGAVDIFATLLEESRRKHGENSLESSLLYYEYGNALFRAASRRLSENEEIKSDADKSAEADKSSDAKPELVAKPSDEADVKLGPQKKKMKIVEDTDDLIKDGEIELVVKENQDTDLGLALEMMENSFAIFDNHLNSKESVIESEGSSKKCHDRNYKTWATNQLPRTLVGIGDILSFLRKHADAADAYTRAIPYRKTAVEKSEQQLIQANRNSLKISIEQLKFQRLLTEAHVLVAEELLMCPLGKDVITTETKVLLVSKDELVDFARGYYDKARDELQNAVYMMGKIAAKGHGMGTEKEDVCFLATMLMGIGNKLADLDEAKSPSECPV